MSEGQHLVLVVDDDLALRESLKFALELEDLEVHACSGGAELLMHPRLPEAACLVVHYEMPVMDGFQVIAELRARRHVVPVVLITNLASAALCRRAAAIGVRHVVEKPLLDSTLIESIQEILGVRG